jgi:hypothetical protein
MTSRKRTHEDTGQVPATAGAAASKKQRQKMEAAAVSSTYREKLMRQLDVDAERANRLLEVASTGLVFNLRDHSRFSQAFREAWEALGLGEKEKPMRNLKCSDTGRERFTRAGRSTGTCEALEVERFDSVQRHRCTRDQMHTLLAHVFTGGWRSEVQRPAELPTSVHRAFRTARLEPSSSFPSLSFSSLSDFSGVARYPWWLDCSVNSLRVEHYRRYLSEEKEEERGVGGGGAFSDGEEDSRSEESQRSERETFAKEALEPAYPLLPEAERVETRLALHYEDHERRSVHWQPGHLLMHPYELSASLFSFSLYLERCVREHASPLSASLAEWDVVRIYLFLRDWLRSGELALKCPAREVPPAVLRGAVLLLKKLSVRGKISSPALVFGEERVMWEELDGLFEFWKGARSLLASYASRGAKQQRDGHLEPFRELASYTQPPSDVSSEDPHLARLVRGDTGSFYYSPSPSPSPSYSPSSYVMICFPRDRVSPLDLRRSLELVERWFLRARDTARKNYTAYISSSSSSSSEVSTRDRREGESLAWEGDDREGRVSFSTALAPSSSSSPQETFGPWRVLFTRRHTVLLCPEEHVKRLRTITRYFNAYVCAHPASFSRRVPYPLYLHQLRGYYHGGRLGMLMAVKWLLRSFTRTQLAKELAHDAATEGFLPLEGDPVVEDYSLLHTLADRFAREELWSLLTSPLCREEAAAPTTTGGGGGRRKRPSPSAVRGLPGDRENLYTALRAFALVYAPHTMAFPVLRQVYTAFQPALQLMFPLTWQLVRRLWWANCHLGESDRVEIPQDMSSLEPAGDEPAFLELFPPPTEEELHAKEAAALKAAEQGKRLRPQPQVVAPGSGELVAHQLFYHLAASQYVSHELATAIFLGMNVITDTRGASTLPPVRLSTFHASSKRKREEGTPLLALAPKMRQAWKEIHMACDPTAFPVQHETDSSHALAFLFRSLEELSFHRRLSRGSTSSLPPLSPSKPLEAFGPEVSTAQVLASPEAVTRSYPLDEDPHTLQPLYAETSFPVWRGDFPESGPEPDALPLPPPSRMEPLPLLGCHQDMLSCVLLYPVRRVQLACLEPLDEELRAEVRRSTSELPQVLRKVNLHEEWVRQQEQEDFQRMRTHVWTVGMEVEEGEIRETVAPPPPPSVRKCCLEEAYRETSLRLAGEMPDFPADARLLFHLGAPPPAPSGTPGPSPSSTSVISVSSPSPPSSPGLHRLSRLSQRGYVFMKQKFHSLSAHSSLNELFATSLHQPHRTLDDAQASRW